VREDALHLLQLLSERFWRSAVTPRTPDIGLGPADGSGVWNLPVSGADAIDAGGGLPQVGCPAAMCVSMCKRHMDACRPPTSAGAPVQVLVGSLQESYHRFQLALSARLARCAEDHAVRQLLGDAGVHTPQSQSLPQADARGSRCLQGAPRDDGAAVRGGDDAAAALQRGGAPARRAGGAGALDGQPVLCGPLGGCGLASMCLPCHVSSPVHLGVAPSVDFPGRLPPCRQLE
jgi:hypothetical protein